MNDHNQIPLSRVFKVGAARIVETDAMRDLTNEQVRELLKTSYPEVANATIREREENGLHVVEFLPQPGRKG
jgi:PRTRC genetic system protein C